MNGNYNYNYNYRKSSSLAKRKSNNIRYLLGVAAIIIILFSMTLLVVAYIKFYQPEVDSSVPFNTGGEPVKQDHGYKPEVGDKIPDEKDDKTPSNVYTRRPDVYNFMVAGLDEVNENHTDTMMVVSFDVANKKVSVMSIPRDTYINVGRNFYKLNSYFTGEYNSTVKKDVSKRGDEARRSAMASLASLVEKNMNIKIDYWVMVNLKGFRSIVDILGGVEVDVPIDMDYEDPEQELYIHLRKGLQTLNGSQAEQFVRFREGYATADKGRMDAQKIFLSALLRTLKTNISISNLSGLISEVSENLLTSIEARDMLYFVKAVYGVDLSDVTFVNLPTESVQSMTTSAWYEVVLRADAIGVINKYVNLYDKNITNSIFDSNRIFTNTSQSYIDDVYNKPASEAGREADTAESKLLNEP